MNRLLSVVLLLSLSVFAVGCGDKEVTEVKGSKPEPSKQEQVKAEEKFKELLENPTYKDVKQEENGPLVDIYELSPEAKHARVVAYGSKYYDRANWSKTVKNGLDFALFSVVTSDRQPRIDTNTFEEVEGTTGAIGLNIAVRNRTNTPYDVGSIRLVTSNGQQFDSPTLWFDSDVNKNEIFPHPVVSPDAIVRWDLMYQVDPRQIKDIEWVQLIFDVWSEDGSKNFKVDSGKILLGEPTKFEQK